MRYGENPHQSAGFYVTGEKRPGVATARQLQGKQLSYNNINDTDAAFELVGEFDRRLGGGGDHQARQPMRRGRAATLREAYVQGAAPATRCRPSAASSPLNRLLDAEAAAEIVKMFTEVIIAPGATEEAHGASSRRRRTCACWSPSGLPDPVRAGLTVKSVAGGFWFSRATMRVVEARRPQGGHQARADASRARRPAFAFRVAKHVKSNAIVYAGTAPTVGIGAGQMSRVDSATHRRPQGAGCGRGRRLSPSR